MRASLVVKCPSMLVAVSFLAAIHAATVDPWFAPARSLA
jgi:hypothetical protein